MSSFIMPTSFFRVVSVFVVSLGPMQASAAVPGAPRNLRVSFVTRSDILLEWTPDALAIRYKAEFRRSSEATSGTFQSYGPGATFMNTNLVVGLLPVNVPHEFKIYAGNEDGWSQAALLSPGVSATDPPQIPTNVRQVSYNETSVTLTWSMPSLSPPATGFKILIRQCRTRDATDLCDPFMTYRQPGADKDFETSQQEMKLVGLQKSYLYEVAVLARNLNVAGYSDGQVEVLRIRPREPLLGVSMDLQVTGVTSSKVFLDWTQCAGAHWYRLEYRQSEIGSGAWLYTATSVTQDTRGAVENLDTGSNLYNIKCVCVAVVVVVVD